MRSLKLVILVRLEISASFCSSYEFVPPKDLDGRLPLYAIFSSFFHIGFNVRTIFLSLRESQNKWSLKTEEVH